MNAIRALLFGLVYPPFTVGFGLSLGALLGFFAWIFIDASFASFVELLRHDLGLSDLQYYAWQLEAMRRPDALGWRINLFWVLLAVGLYGAVIVGLRLCIGQSRGRSIAGWLLALALAAGWLSLAGSYPMLRMQGLYWRVDNMLGRIAAHARADAVATTGEGDAEAALLGMLSPQEADIWSMFAMVAEMEEKQYRYPICEEIGRVQRLPGGIVRVALEPGDLYAEWHPEGSHPTGYYQAIGDAAAGSPRRGIQSWDALRWWAELREGWFITDVERKYDYRRN